MSFPEQINLTNFTEILAQYQKTQTEHAFGEIKLNFSLQIALIKIMLIAAITSDTEYNFKSTEYIHGLYAIRAMHRSTCKCIK